MAKTKKVKGIASSKVKSQLVVAQQKGKKKLGHYSFLVGIILAIIAGIFIDPLRSPFVSAVVGILVVLGIIVGGK